MQVERPAVALPFLQVARTRVARAREHEHAPALRAVASERYERIGAQIGTHSDGIRAQPRGDGPERRRAAEERLSVSAAGRSNVAALDVDDDRQIVALRTADDGGKGLPAGRPILLEERCLRLDAGRHAGDGVDDAAAKVLDAGGRGLLDAQIGHLTSVRGNQVGRHALQVGVEPDAHDAAARQDGRR